MREMCSDRDIEHTCHSSAHSSKEAVNEVLEGDSDAFTYEDRDTINNYPSSFNLTNKNIRPDLRNIKYKTTTEHLSCPICQQPFIAPLTTACGHTFCKECICEYFRISKSSGDGELKGFCPLDRFPINAGNTNDLFPAPLIISNLVDDLQVYCSNSERGCEWSGSRWELEHHLMVDCGYTGVHCNGVRRIKKADASCSKDPQDSEDGSESDPIAQEEYYDVICDKLIERRFCSDDGTCVHRIISCDYCQMMITEVSKSSHLETECLRNYQTCELCFNDMIPLKNLEKHKDNCSKIRHFKCPAHVIGCKWVGNNEPALEAHLQNNCQLYQLSPFFDKISTKIENLEKDNVFLQKEINRILSSITQGKIMNLGYSEPLEEIGGINEHISSQQFQDKVLFFTFELDRLKFELEKKIMPYIDRESASSSNRESLINGLVNDNFMMKDDLNLQRMQINSLRKQLQFLLLTRNSRGMGFPPTNNMTPGVDLDGLDLLEMPSRNNSDEKLNLKL
ncbi:Piso0_003122 [Millerozyma farinosa CBS 7064]|uniref:Piso0_003122 protein n=1 Tax=Pichia sorbitophila (strain ATCC MYA-4447 / BCRC 22081 / CBS 7064 / NBRC 10061 / NRRL Y-12695) TaxID=559304 RepID=G8YH88_PICSO|nr:Piso0_003122 [Millerozyma farinosa CBS 7064]CCE80790.1 Piso0_003122 [Millerozyma farinosa CBS 7064]